MQILASQEFFENYYKTLVKLNYVKTSGTLLGFELLPQNHHSLYDYYKECDSWLDIKILNTTINSFQNNILLCKYGHSAIFSKTEFWKFVQDNKLMEEDCVIFDIDNKLNPIKIVFNLEYFWILKGGNGSVELVTIYLSE